MIQLSIFTQRQYLAQGSWNISTAESPDRCASYIAAPILQAAGKAKTYLTEKI